MINGTTITLLFGLPGAGKTTALGKVMERDKGLKRLSGGSLIAASLPEADRDRLRKIGANDILINQEKLILNFQREFKTLKNERVVFDGHCVVKDGNNVIEIPLVVIERLYPDQIIFFDVEPEVIAERRGKDALRPDREIETIVELEAIRNLQKKICGSYAAALTVPLINASNEEELAEALK
jgi:adenylate kinase